MLVSVFEVHHNLRQQGAPTIFENPARLPILSWIIRPLFVEKAEALAWWPANYQVCRRNLKTGSIDNVDEIAGSTDPPKIGVVGVRGILVEIVRPDSLK